MKFREGNPARRRARRSTWLLAMVLGGVLPVGTWAVAASATTTETSSSRSMVEDAARRAILRVREHAAASVIAGRTVRWTIEVTNAGRGPARNVRFHLDEGVFELERCRLTGVQGSCDEHGSRVAVDRLGRGSRFSVELTLRVEVDVARRRHRLAVRVTSPDDKHPSLHVARVVRVTPLPAPTISRLEERAGRSRSRPVIVGRGDPHSIATVTRGGKAVCEDIRINRAGSWRCRPAKPLPRGRIRLSASQVDLNDLRSRRSVTVLQVGPSGASIVRPPRGTPPRGTPPDQPAIPSNPVGPGGLRGDTPGLAANTPEPKTAVQPPASGAGKPPVDVRRPTPPAPQRLIIELRAASAWAVRGDSSSSVVHHGRLGPHVGERPVAVEVTGRTVDGGRYRAVRIGDLRCDVAPATFVCAGRLKPGASVPILIRSRPGADGPSSRVIQRIDVTSPDGYLAGSFAQRMVSPPPDSDDGVRWQMTSAPGMGVVILALLLFALAARRSEGRAR